MGGDVAQAQRARMRDQLAEHAAPARQVADRALGPLVDAERQEAVELLACARRGSRARRSARRSARAPRRAPARARPRGRAARPAPARSRSAAPPRPRRPWSAPANRTRSAADPTSTTVQRGRARIRVLRAPGRVSGVVDERNRNLVLATLAFAFCFSAWGMLAPLGPKLQDELGLSEHRDGDDDLDPGGPRLAAADSARAAHRPARRPGVFAAMLFYSAGAAVLVGFASSYAALLAAGFLLGAAGASFAVGVPFVAGGSSRSGRASRSASTGSATSAPPSPPSRSRPSATAPARRSAGIVFGVVIAVFALIWWRLPATLRASGRRLRYREVLRRRLAAVAAVALLLRHLRRLRRDGDLPAEAAQGLVRALAHRRRPARGRLHRRRHRARGRSGGWLSDRIGG